MRLYIILIIAFLFVSCEETLVEKPRDLMDPSQFFNSDEEAIGAVNGIYSRGVAYLYGDGGGSWMCRYWSSSHMGTDIAATRKPKSAPHHTYTLGPNYDGEIRESWEVFYRTIADANMVVKRVEDAKENFSNEVYNQSIGQAKFLRAFFYWVLTNHWGDVPMWLDELDVQEIRDLPRTPVNDIYDHMIIDLEDAIEKLPSSWTGMNKGRATKWAAMMLLTKVYLLQEDWANAKETSGTIIDESPHTLVSDYGNIFGVENEYNSEIIWQRDAVVDVYDITVASRYTPRAKDLPDVADTEEGYRFDGNGVIHTADEFVATFDPDDQRKPWYNLNGVYDDPDGDGVYDNWVQFDQSYVKKNIEPGANKGNNGLNQIIYRLADAYLMYAEAENELNGPTEEAYSKINRIRDRAFGDDPAKRLSGLSQEEFRQAIMDERKWELGFEYHRRWDLNRWGKLDEAVASLQNSNSAGAENFKSYHVLFPIPFQELDLNPSLKQNTGYGGN